MKLRENVEVVEKAVAEREEAHDPAVVLCNPDLVVLGEDLADPSEHVLRAMAVGQIGHAFPPRAYMDIRERRRVLRHRSPERKPHECIFAPLLSPADRLDRPWLLRNRGRSAMSPWSAIGGQERRPSSRPCFFSPARRTGSAPSSRGRQSPTGTRTS